MKNTKNKGHGAEVVKRIPIKTLEKVKEEFSSRDSNMPNPPYD